MRPEIKYSEEKEIYKIMKAKLCVMRQEIDKIREDIGYSESLES